jgi:hypothetical protein
MSILAWPFKKVIQAVVYVRENRTEIQAKAEVVVANVREVDMLLKRLWEYSQGLELPPVGYERTPIRWLINLNAAGDFLGFITTSSGKKRDRGMDRLAPYLLVSSRIKAKLLVGNGEYVLGIARDQAKQDQVIDRHRAFKDQVNDCAAVTKISSVKAVSRFLDSLDLKTLVLPEDFDPSMNLTFQVEATFPIDLPEETTLSKHSPLH